MIDYRPVRFFVDHTPISTENGGSQGEPETFGPYTGTLMAPGSTRRPNEPTLNISIAGAQSGQPRWTLLAPPFTKIAYGSGASDYVNADGFGRFRVAGVRPVADILPPTGLIIGLDEIK